MLAGLNMTAAAMTPGTTKANRDMAVMHASEQYKAGARAFPLLVPITPDNPASAANRKAWDVLRQWDGRVLTLFSDQDAVTAGGEKPFRQLPGAQGQPHATIVGGGHFLQEDKPEELAERIIDWLRA